MNKRTRLLAWTALGMAGLLVAGFAIRAIVVQPLRTLDDRIVQLRLKLRSLDGERKAFLAADSQVRAAAATLFAAKPAEAESRLGAMLTAQLLQAGLREADFSRVPAGRRRLPGGEEIGWTVQGEGQPARVLDFLYLIQADPRLLRIESIALSPASDPLRIRVRFRCLTLVLNPSPEVLPTTSIAPASLETPARRRYDAILRRNLLRPHEPEETPTSPIRTTPGTAPAESGPAEAQSLRIVSLSSWGSQPEAHLLDLRSHQTRVVRPGDTLLDGEVATIDFRPVPSAAKPGLFSYSRLIWRSGETYWSIENGQTLADRQPLAPGDLPPSLPTVATPTPSQP